MKQENVTVDSRIDQLISAVQESDIKAVRKLLSDGVDPNGRNSKQKTPLVPGTCTTSWKIVKLLLQYGARLEDTNSGGWTPLGAAALGGNLKVVKLLLDSGANPNAIILQNGHCCGSPLTAALSINDLRVIRLLLHNGADVNTVCLDYGATALEYAVAVGYLEPFKLLMERSPALHHQHNAFYLAAVHDRVDIMEWLMRKGIDPDAVKFEEPPLISAAKLGRVSAMALLLEHGADVNCNDKAGWTPLRHAVANGHQQLADILRMHGGRE